MRETVLVPRFSRVLCVLVVAMCVSVVVALVAFGRVDLVLRGAAPAALLAVGAVVVLWLPKVRVGPAELEIVNPLRTHLVSWPAVLDVETKWTLTIVTARGRIQVFAAPAPGPFGNVGSMRRDHYGALVSEPRRATPSAIGDVAAMLVLRQWQDYRDRGLLGAPEREGSTVRLHTAWIVALGMLTAATVVGLAWP